MCYVTGNKLQLCSWYTLQNSTLSGFRIIFVYPYLSVPTRNDMSTELFCRRECLQPVRS